MKRWCVVVCFWAACAHAPPRHEDVQAILTSTSNPSGLSCIHCHGTPGDGRTTPAPRLPGRVVHARNCASERQSKPLTASQDAALASWLHDAPAAQPPWVPPTPANVETALHLDGNAWNGEQLFQRACVACHGEHGPGPHPSLMTVSPTETTLKVMQGTHAPGDVMPVFPVTALSEQDVADLAAYVGKQG